MIDTLPSSIAISPQQKEALEVIAEELRNLQDPDWPPRVILLWSDGTPQSDAAVKLDIGVEAVERLCRRWLSAAPRIGAAEARVSKAFTTFFSLVCDTLSQESPTAATSGSPEGITKTGAANQGRLIESKELRQATKALIEILHHQPKVYGINRSNWTLQSLAEAFAKLYGQKPSKSTISRLLREGGLRWKKSRQVLTSPDPNYREKVDLLLKTLQSLKPDEDLFFIDELGSPAGLSMLPAELWQTFCYFQRDGEAGIRGTSGGTTGNILGGLTAQVFRWLRPAHWKARG